MNNRDETDHIYSVSEITRDIKSLLEEEFPSIWVEGEISNYLKHTSGHRYFTLKDESAQIKAVIWKFSASGLQFEPKDGLKVRAFGDITLYEKGGNYQLRVIRLLQAGLGNLEEQFRKLKEKLLREGLFDDARKRPIPSFPHTIGIVTSPTGAAIRDIISICRRRAPMVRLVLRPTKVQGVGASEDIVAAIDEFNRWGEADLLIVGRGGGSLEDLWAFNEEIVARAMAASEIPIISAVGHEVDFSIADFVADLRAPTPSAAAELATYDAASLRAAVSDMSVRFRRALERQVASRRERLERALRSRALARPELLVEPFAQRLDDVVERAILAFHGLVEGHKHRLALAGQKLEALSPQNVLRRGYAVVHRSGDRSIVRSAGALAGGDRLEIEFGDGSVPAVVE